MPELPEAEANRLRVEQQCLHRTIEAAVPGDNVSYIELPGDNERKRLIGRQFTETRRHGKMIFAGSKTGPWIGVHLGMTGRLVPYDDDDAGDGTAPEDPKFIIGFEGKRRLAFLDKRKLGWLRVLDDPDAFIADERYGPDALAISAEDFAHVIGGTGGAVKAALMDQHKLAGIGNLWSDEILFQSGIAPIRIASELSDRKLSEIHQIMREVLETVTATQMDYSSLPDDWLVHYRKKLADCPRCGGSIESRKIGGRTAYFCPKQQH